MASPTVHVTGYRETMLAFKIFGGTAQAAVKKELAKVSAPIIADTQGRLSRYRGVSSSTIRPHLLARGVVVRQDKRKTTGVHPNFGSIQMKALLGAAYDREAETVRALEDALDNLADGLGL